MLKSDRIYFAQYAVDPEMELDELDLYFDDENTEIAREIALDSRSEIQDEDMY